MGQTVEPVGILPFSHSGRQGGGAHGFQHTNQVVHLSRLKQPVWPMWTEIGKGRFIESGRFHDAMLGQMIHDQVDELKLVGSEGLPGNESRECLFGRATIHADERSHEETETLSVSRGPTDIVQRSSAALCKDTLQFGKVCDSERLVHAQLGNHHMVEVFAQERSNFGQKLSLVSTYRKTGKNNFRLAPHEIFKVGVDGLPAPLFDKLDQLAQPATHRL